MKKLLRKILNKFGFDIIKIINSNDNLEKHLQNVLNSREIDCIFDVGANTGQYALFLRKLGYKGYIISFEPVSSVFHKLEKNSQYDEKWHCYNFALGDKNEVKLLNVYSSTVFSSFLNANDYSKTIWQSLEDVKTEPVKIYRLEDVWKELTSKLSCNNFMLKLDTQGFDKNVFSGATNCLKNISVLQSELSLIEVYEAMPDTYEVLKDFNKYGFFISGMYPINRDKSLAVIEYDCVMIKKNDQ